MNWWKKYQDKILLVLKWLIFGVTIIYVYKVTFQSQDFDKLIGSINRFDVYSLVLLGATCLLMIANWGLEALKWQTLLKYIQEIRWFTAFRAVMSGVTVSSIMPNRLAEYLGRIFYIPPQKRVKTIIATLVGSFAQTFITVLTGSVAFLFYFRSVQPENIYIFYILLALVIGLNGILVLLYFNVALVNRLIPTKSYLIRFKQYLKILAYFHSYGLTKVLVYSLLRYVVFLTQFILLLYAFGVHLRIVEALISIPLNFFAQAVIPTIALTELGVRGATAIHFIGYYTGAESNILLGSYTLWVINLLLPAVLGAIFLVIQNTNNKRLNASSEE